MKNKDGLKISLDRESKEAIKSQNSEIENSDYIKSVINSLSHILLIINNNRQTIFSNEVLLNKMGITDLDKLLGLKPGEILNCVNSRKTVAGCGGSEACKYCEMLAVILKSQDRNEKEEGSCRIIAKDPHENDVFYDLSITSSPFIYNDHTYYVLSIFDISSENRRKNLERIFFHDILNTAGGIKGLVEIMTDFSHHSDTSELMNYLKTATDQLVSEIIEQKDLLSAESGSLKVNISEADIHQILSDCIASIKHHDVAFNKNINLTTPNLTNIVTTDTTLLKRVLINMIKNALEAINEEESVNLSYNSEKNGFSFHVQNSVVMPEEIKMQIFQRNFSTKGPGRGIGTYSMKLLGEQYLKGQVSFVSTEADGTIFTLWIPNIS